MYDTIRLFNAVLVQDKTIKHYTSDTLEHMITRGYYIDPRISPTTGLIGMLDELVGRGGDMANASFHKSWAKVRDASMDELVMEQVCHYITTYGFEALGIYDSDTVYVPIEDLDIPEVKSIPLTYIKAVDKDELKELILDLAGSGIALGQETVQSIVNLIKSNYKEDIVPLVKNREVKAELMEHFGIVPTDPTEYLRYIIKKLTGETLVIKNRKLIEQIKMSNGRHLDELIAKAPADLGSIFLRFKPLFLAMKSVSSNKTFFNKLRKDAVTMHEPIGEDYLNSITAQLKWGGYVDEKYLKQKLGSASMFRKIRLLNALQYRRNPGESIVYKVRNGKGYAKDFMWTGGRSSTGRVYDMVLESIADSIRSEVNGKKFFIPEGIKYALPATEKQFAGNLPAGSGVEVDEDLIVAINWKNLKGYRVDLDFSVLTHDNIKVGWDSHYRYGRSSGGRSGTVMFSGDITDARGANGATETFYFPKGVAGQNYLLTVNYFNYNEKHPVDCHLIIAKRKLKTLDRSYMVDPNDILAKCTITLDQPQTCIGIVATDGDKARVHFTQSQIGVGRSMGASEHAKRTRDYFFAQTSNPVNLEDVLVKAGALIVREMDSDSIDLSPTAINKTTLVKLFSI